MHLTRVRAQQKRRCSQTSVWGSLTPPRNLAEQLHCQPKTTVNEVYVGYYLCGAGRCSDRGWGRRWYFRAVLVCCPTTRVLACVGSSEAREHP